MPIFSKVLGGIDENDPKSLKQISNHIRVMQEELEYRLSCLDSSNISEIDISETNIITPEGNLYHLIGSKDGAYSELSMKIDEFSVKMQDIEGNYSSLVTRVDSIETFVGNSAGDFTSITQRVNDIELRVQDAEGNYSTLTQDVNSIEGRIETVEGDFATMKLTIDGLDITTKDGTTTISGSSIETGTVTADALRLQGDLTIYNGDNEDDIGGYMGYAASLQTGGSGMHMECGKGECAVTDSGARLMYHSELDEDGDGSPDHSMIAVYEGGAVISAKNKAFYFNTAAFYGEAEQDLGVADHPWAQIYTAAATATTSDRKAKYDINYDIDQRYDLIWQQLKPCTGKYMNGRSDRTHMFLIAQDVEQAIEQAGLTSKDFAAFVRSGEFCSLRYEEFIPMIIRRVQRLEGILEGGNS